MIYHIWYIIYIYILYHILFYYTILYYTILYHIISLLRVVNNIAKICNYPIRMFLKILAPQKHGFNTKKNFKMLQFLIWVPWLRKPPCVCWLNTRLTRVLPSTPRSARLLSDGRRSIVGRLGRGGFNPRKSPEILGWNELKWNGLHLT